MSSVYTSVQQIKATQINSKLLSFLLLIKSVESLNNL